MPKSKRRRHADGMYMHMNARQWRRMRLRMSDFERTMLDGLKRIYPWVRFPGEKLPSRRPARQHPQRRHNRGGR